ncbi:MAG: hypothetical protein EKK65_00310 [Lysobacterales bacterium]|nr:MAG: hypothetical protein EKK65_00310 [Xanthomonadales bacterium]
MDGRCGTCRHWGKFGEGKYQACRAIPETSDQADEMEAALGSGWWDDHDCLYECDDDARWMDVCHPDIGAYTQDASSYASSLMTSAEFGCTAWEGKN